MAQTWTDDPFSSGNVGQTDLQNIENNLLALKSNFSGTSAPSNAVAGMQWYDSGSGNKVMKIYLDSSWVAYMHGDTSQKIPVYRNTAMDGWSIDSTSATDRVLAMKGGSTYTTGGANAGSWVISGLSSGNDTHCHRWYNYSGSVNHNTYQSDGSSSQEICGTNGNSYDHIVTSTDSGDGMKMMDADGYTNDDTHNHTVSHAGGWRISSAVFTLQYLDI